MLVSLPTEDGVLGTLCFYWKQIHQGTPHFRITRSKIVFNWTSWQIKLSTLIFCRIVLGIGKVEEHWVDAIQSSSVFQSYFSLTQGSLSASLDRHSIKSWDSTNYSLKSRFKLSWSCYTLSWHLHMHWDFYLSPQTLQKAQAYILV